MSQHTFMKIHTSFYSYSFQSEEFRKIRGTLPWGLYYSSVGRFLFSRQPSGRVVRFSQNISDPAVLCSAALEAQRVFAVLSFLMAASTSALCLVFALCWTSQTVHSYSNTRSLLMAGQALYPTTLLLLTMSSTGNMAAPLMSSGSQCFFCGSHSYKSFGLCTSGQTL